MKYLLAKRCLVLIINGLHTCTTIIKPHIINIPFFPRTSKKSCAMGRGSVDENTSETDAVANDAAIRRIHPRLAVPATPMRIAYGAARAAPATSSETLEEFSSKVKRRIKTSQFT